MLDFTPEMIEKARAAKSAEELLTLAKAAGIEDFTEENATAYFARLHPVSGELSDDELDNVAGGGCYNKGQLVVTVGTRWCDCYECKYCHRSKWELEYYGQVDTIHLAHGCNGRAVAPVNACGSCLYCSYDGALWKCTNPKKRK